MLRGLGLLPAHVTGIRDRYQAGENVAGNAGNHRVSILLLTAHAVLLAALMLILAGWLRTYPASLPASGTNLDAISPLFWAGLFMAYPATAILGIYGTRKMRLFATVILVFLFTGPKLLYLTTGSDTKGIVGLLDYFQAHGSLDPHTKTYDQWPVVLFWGSLFKHMCQCGSAQAYWLYWLIQILLFGVGLHLVFGGDDTDNPVGFIASCLYLVVLFWIWDWQVSPYNWALGLTLALIAIVPISGVPQRIVAVLLFTVVSFSHGGVNLWILLAAIIWVPWIYWKHRATSKTGNLLLLFAVIQVAVVAYYNIENTRYLALTLRNYYTELLQDQLAGNALATAASHGAQPVSGWLEVSTKAISFLTVAWAALLVVVGFLWGVYRRSFSSWRWSVSLAALIHFFIGNLLPILGIRSLNILALLPAQGGAELVLRRRSRPLVIVSCVVILTLFPVTQLRTEILDLRYNTPRSYDASAFLASLIRGRSFRSASPPVVLAPEQQRAYIQQSLPSGAAVMIDTSRDRPKDLAPRLDLLLLNRQLILAVRGTPWEGTVRQVQDRSFEGGAVDLLYGNGEESVFLIRHCGRVHC